MLLPDTVGTGGDSHRFPYRDFPAGSGLVAFAAATGVMPLDMPESVLVRFKGKCSRDQHCVIRCMLSRITLFSAGLLTVEKKGKKNIFRSYPPEIEGLPTLESGTGV